MCLAPGSAESRGATPAPTPTPPRASTRWRARADALVDGDGLRASSSTRQRELFAIGYRLRRPEGPGRLDPSFYDLLASEARLASFVAIAKGDVPQSHWFRLGRPLTQRARRAGAAVVERHDVRVPDAAAADALATPRRCSTGRAGWRCAARSSTRDALGVPWGISESAYSVVDRHGTYQYRAFGVPGLGLTRGLGDELVVAPYATALAALVDARRRPWPTCGGWRGAGAARRVRLLRGDRLHAARRRRRRTPARGAAPTPAPSCSAYMSHHQGMRLVALANVLLDDVHGRALPSRPARAGDRAAAAGARAARRRRSIDAAAAPRTMRVPAPAPAVPVRRYRSPHTRGAARAVPVERRLRGGRHQRAAAAAARAAAARSRGWRRDATRDPASHGIYLRDVAQRRRCGRRRHQPTARRARRLRGHVPLRQGDASAAATTTSRRSSTSRCRPRTTSRCAASRCANHGARVREIEVTSYAEIALARAARRPRASGVRQALRRDRVLAGEHGAALPAAAARASASRSWAVHVLSLEGRPQGAGRMGDATAQRFLGRGRTLRRPLALDGRPLSGTTGVVLDPVCSLRQRVRLPPGGQVAAVVRHRRRRRPRGGAARWPRSTTTRRGGAHLRAGLHPRPEPAAPPRRLARRTRGSSSGWPRCCSTSTSRRAPSRRCSRRNTLGQSGLWRHGLSGDLPIAARARRRRRDGSRPGAAGAAGAGVLAPQGPASPTSSS